MNIKIFLIAIAMVSISSCSTVYKSGQTPDDVYYSPVRPLDDREEADQTRENRREDYSTDNYEEREIRMATRDRRWRDLNDYYDYNYSYNPYMYGYNYGYYYNPYYYNRPVFLPGYVIVNPKNNTPRMTNLGSYNNSTLVVSNNKAGQTKWVQAARTYNNNNNSNNSGSFIRRIIRPSDSYSNPGYNNNNRNSGMESNNSRTYNPSSGNNNSSRSSSSPSGSSSGGGAVSRPSRGN